MQKGWKVPHSWKPLIRNARVALRTWASVLGLKFKPPIEMLVDYTDKPQGTRIVREVTLSTDFRGALVKPHELKPVRSRDGFRALTHPLSFETVSEANRWLRDYTQIFVLESPEGEKQVFPWPIIRRHAIVNTKLGQDDIIVAVCKICGTANAYIPIVNGYYTEFGESGIAYQGNMVMYDRLEGDRWEQASGRALVGPAARRGEVLPFFPVMTTRWDLWRDWHPDSKVLSRANGPYRYDPGFVPANVARAGKAFGADFSDRCLAPEAEVHALILPSGEVKAYPTEVFEDLGFGTIHDTIGRHVVTLTRSADGVIGAQNQNSGQELRLMRGFWFALAAKYPHMTIYED